MQAPTATALFSLPDGADDSETPSPYFTDRPLEVGKVTRVTNKIRPLRAAAGDMTQVDLAERIGVTRQTVIAIEQGRYSPSLEVAFKMARVFGVSLEEVFQYPEDP
jgi:putative transcriptional regulator